MLLYDAFNRQTERSWRALKQTTYKCIELIQHTVDHITILWLILPHSKPISNITACCQQNMCFMPKVINSVIFLFCSLIANPSLSVTQENNSMCLSQWGLIGSDIYWHTLASLNLLFLWICVVFILAVL